jgi:hypothetical protein
MPRAGGVYSAPPGTNGAPNTTIASAPYNAFVADIVADANAARPVTAGGTGSSTAVGGADNLDIAGADIASAATVNLALATGTLINITGTVTITALGTVAAGAIRDLVFAGVLTLTHNATSLILPGAANIVTAAGDVARMRSLGGGNWRCLEYTRAATAPFGSASPTIVTPTLTLKQSATPTPTAEGDIQWDTDDNVIVVGDGAGQQIFVPLPAGTAAGDTLYLSAAKVLTRIAKGTAAQRFAMNDAATAPAWRDEIAQSAAVDVSAGATTYDVTGIPSWARRVTILLRAVSFTASNVTIRLGSSGGIVATGYSGASSLVQNGAATSSLSTGISAGGSGVVHGIVTAIRMSANLWAFTMNICLSDATYTINAYGSVDVAATLDRIRLTTTGGAATGNGGSMVVTWE